MAKVFITGSSDGLGLLAGRQLAAQGHEVVLHARNEERAVATRRTLPECKDVLIGDLSTIAAMEFVASQANARGRFDAVIHNVGTGYNDRERYRTSDNLSRIFAVNVLAPYVLTARMTVPDRLVYLSSGMHTGGDPDLVDAQWEDRRWNASQAYCDTKLYDTVLTMALAARWTQVMVNAVDPGWVPTKMGGAGAPDDLNQGADTQAWLAVSQDPKARVSGEYFHHRQRRKVAPAAHDAAVQDRLLAYLYTLSGTPLP
jgi:NAD(P)-dependent dehydrogenase (short-subunit alcohol dehydrogenase family)